MPPPGSDISHERQDRTFPRWQKLAYGTEDGNDSSSCYDSTGRKRSCKSYGIHETTASMRYKERISASTGCRVDNSGKQAECCTSGSSQLTEDMPRVSSRDETSHSRGSSAWITHPTVSPRGGGRERRVRRGSGAAPAPPA